MIILISDYTTQLVIENNTSSTEILKIRGFVADFGGCLVHNALYDVHL